MAKILEAEKKEFMSKKEQALKKRLIALLKDDGKGHRHAKFAKRLEDFIIKIVDRETDPNMTAAVNWEAVTIYISSGFLSDPSTFFQLNVLMRHELAHHLMQHQLRMMHIIVSKYGEEGYTHIKMSQSLHELMNVIEDFEISNKRYTDEDKITVRNMVLNGRIIGGLVTEDQRKAWMNMSVEEMYIELCKEIDSINQSILARWDILDMSQIGNPKDYLHHSIKDTLYIYTKIDRPTNFFCTLPVFIKNRGLYHFVPFDEVMNGQVRPCIVKFSTLPDIYQDIIVAIDEEFKASAGYLKQDIRDIVTQIAKSNPTVKFDLTSKQNGNIISTLWTPEEKLLAIDALKTIIPGLEDYNTWYGKVQKTLSDPKYSDDDLARILGEIDK